MPKSCAKITKLLDDSKSILKNLKLDQGLTLSKALEKKKETSIVSVNGIASSIKQTYKIKVKRKPSHETDRTIDESEIKKHDLNIDQKSDTILNDENEFAVPNTVQPQTIPGLAEANLSQSNSSTNESQNPLEMNVDSKSATLKINMSSAAERNLPLNESQNNSGL